MKQIYIMTLVFVVLMSTITDNENTNILPEASSGGSSSSGGGGIYE